MHKSKLFNIISVCLLAGFIGFGCNSENGQGENNSDTPTYFNVDLRNAEALLTEQTGNAVEGLTNSILGKSVNTFAQTQTVDESSSNLKKLTANGEIEEVIETFDQESEGQSLPRISTVGISTAGDVYLHFERPFIYQKPDSNAVDPWMSSSPYTCQIFKVTERLEDANISTVQGLNVSNVECIDATHEVDSWQTRGGLFQFDRDSNLYYTAHDPGSWKNVVYKYVPTTGERIEIINANICFHDYLVSPAGGVFYTGTTSIDGDCSGSSFFRYVTASGKLVEITRDWWDYTWAPSPSGEDEKVIFYGPDTVTSGIPSWDSACLYEFDPTVTDNPSTTDTDERATRLVDCRSDIWGYVYDWTLSDATRKSRCIETKHFLGGSQIDDILIDEVSNDVYVIGEIRKKKAGTWNCHLCVNEAHCSDLQNASDTQGTCEAKGKTWISEGRCYNDQTGTTCDVSDPNWDIHWQGCQEPSGIGDRWSNLYTALAKVDRNTGDMEMLSSTTEAVQRASVINGKVYYTSYSTGTYYLKEVGETSNRTLLSGIEVYSLDPSPLDSNLLFSGLNFTNNKHIFGSFNPEDANPETTVDSIGSLTGEVETVIILP